ncbi:MAG: stage 0 sporulation family protein [Nitrospirae bacterium]|nr:stage 0 sporulation family protein [Nitrospirota bacterium]
MQENNDILETHDEAEPPLKHTVVGIRFRRCGKVYTFEVNGLDVHPGAKVVVESEMGLSIGNVVTPKCSIEKPDGPLKKVIRMVSEEDLETIKNNRALEEEAKVFCANRAKELNLPMKIVSAETTLDKKRLIFYFTADGRIDFRELVRDLAARFKTRIEMRQIGVRDEVKILGGIGCCGRQTCCSLFLTSFEPVTIKMAKQQDLSINQSKLSGICGRLMCCLGYECKDAPEEETAPPKGEDFITVTDEPSAGPLQKLDSEVISAPESEQHAESPRGRDERQRTDVPGREQQQKEGAAPDQFRRDRHHRRRRHRPRKHSPENAAQAAPPQQRPVQPEKPVQQNEPRQGGQQPADAEGKGKPFNKRRRFWHKKKQ